MLERKHLVVLLGGSVLVVGMFVVLAVFPQSGLLRNFAVAPALPTAVPSASEEPFVVAESVAHTAGKEAGDIIPQYADDHATLVGWVYQGNDTEHTCTAGPDGVWTGCTFSPRELPWPAPVPSQVLASPPPLRNEAGDLLTPADASAE